MSSRIADTENVSEIKPCHKFEGHTGLLEGAIHLPGGQRMMTCSWDGSLRVWNLKSGKQIGEDWQDGDSEAVWTIALSPDGKKVASGSNDGGVKLWDMDTRKVIAKWTGHTGIVTSVCWSRDGQQVMSGSGDGTVREWDAEKGETILGPIETGHEYVFAVVYSPDMTVFATGGRDRPNPDSESKIKIWDLKTGKLVATLKGHTRGVACLAWTPDGKMLISGSDDHSIRTWNTSNWKQIAVFDGHTNAVYGIAISPNGRILASASTDNTARLWNLDNNQPINLPLNHTDIVSAVSFSADGKLLATGCDDKNAYTWDVFAISKQAGLDDLLLDKPDESLLVTDATRRPARRQPIKVSPRVPRGFFDDIPDRAHSSVSHPQSSPSHRGNLRSRFLSLFRPSHYDAHHTPSRPRPFHWIRNRLFARSGGSDIELHERSSAAVASVPYARGKRRNASAREKRRILKLPTAANLPPPNNTVTQQSNGAAQTQSSSQPHASVSNSTASPVVAHSSSNSNPHATIKHAGRWTRFWLFICCASPEYTDGHH